jgi:hypothetical protein
VAVQGNFLGTDATGTSALANGNNGSEITGNYNTIGGTATGARNIISGNTSDGINVENSTLIKIRQR